MKNRGYNEAAKSFNLISQHIRVASRTGCYFCSARKRNKLGDEHNK